MAFSIAIKRLIPVYDDQGYHDFNKIEEKQYFWTVGEQAPIEKETDEILVFEAWGQELVFIRENFTNIPMSNKSENMWRQPWASFILENL